MPLAFLATRAHCWLMVILLSTRTPRSFSSELLFSRGDYRTGKRLNMRKVIPYIASQFRKDKIWLRRTKPSKRQYQICLAIDDSSSMIDNHSKQAELVAFGKSDSGDSGAVIFLVHMLEFFSLHA
ncbi:hypothetical protein llap_22348 [Limosa lapponica baueri]|uniref:Uncharacterized protein n=1 Tax=Limosa lapponica baueri TaxID=1758121 RepID=A0A2I0T0M7_LIMLA|nr:hypothetical protein llap_22348 [Limosa lapponica baueri]